MEKGLLKIDPESASIQTHLGILQNIIQRMSGNSSNCKAWCVSLVAAILVIIADKGRPEYAWIALMPTIIFMTLDAYYLAMEKGFRSSYNKFISNLHKNELKEDDLYSVIPDGKINMLQLEAFKSFSVWGFYFSMLGIIAITKEIALG